jgi:hypothetical protein
MRPGRRVRGCRNSFWQQQCRQCKKREGQARREQARCARRKLGETPRPDANLEKRTGRREPEAQEVCQCCWSKAPNFELCLCSYIDSATRFQCENAFCGSCVGNHKRESPEFQSSFTRLHMCEMHRAADTSTAMAPTMRIFRQLVYGFSK